MYIGHDAIRRDVVKAVHQIKLDRMSASIVRAIKLLCTDVRRSMSLSEL